MARHYKLIPIRVEHDDPVAVAVISELLRDELVTVMDQWVEAMNEPKPVIVVLPISGPPSPTTLKPH